MPPVRDNDLCQLSLCEQRMLVHHCLPQIKAGLFCVIVNLGEKPVAIFELFQSLLSAELAEQSGFTL